MKKTLLALAISLSMLFSSSSHEKNIKYQPYQSTITVGKNNFAKDSRMEDSTIFGIRATAYDGDIFRYGLQLGYESAIDTKYEGIDSTELITKTDLHRFFVNMIVDGEEEYNVVPYLLFGMGYEYLSDELSNQDVSQGFAQTGLGFRYNITRSLNIALEGRVLGKFDTRDVDFIFNGGIGYMFGNNISSKKLVGFNTKKKDKSTPSSIIASAPLSASMKNKANNRADNQNIDLSMTVAPTVESKSQSIVIKDVNLIENDEVVVFDDLEPSENLENVVYEEDKVKKIASPLAPSYSNQGRFYVQMAAYRSRHFDEIVSKLRNIGYNNTIVHTIASSGKDLHLTLVGPYLTKNEARKVQRRLKKINPQAFIYKMN